MSLTRKLLTGLGIEPAHIETIIEAHVETVDALKAERDQYKEVAESVPDLQSKLEEAEADGSRLADLQAKYDALEQQLKDSKKEAKEVQASYDEYKAGVEAKETSRAKAEAYREQVVKAAGIADKYVKTVMRVSKTDEITLSEDGKVENAKDLIKAVKDEYGDFVAKTKTDVEQPATPPEGVRGGIAGAHERAVQINKEYRERMYGKPKE